MKNVKRVFGLLLALSLIAAACGSEESPEESSEATEDSGSTTAPVDEAEDSSEGMDDSADTAAPGEGTENAKIAFLMPDIASTRYEQFDAPLFTARIAELCPGCEVIFLNANADAAQQQEQANSALAQGISAMVLDPVDSAAAVSIVKSAQDQGVPVIAYDRPIPDGGADYYVSFDNEAIGQMIGQSLIDELDRTEADGGILIVNGSPTDAAAQLIKAGIHNAADPSGYETLAEFDTPGWAPPEAQNWVAGQISQFGDEIVGVIAANDGTGGGSIAAFKAAGVEVPPVSGNDAELAALQRIVAGDQYNTISKPISIVAEAAADVAWAFVQSEPPAGETTLFDTPSVLFTPEVVTQDNIVEVVTAPGFAIAVEDICSDEFVAACEAIGLS